jgi:hypothetical protein
MQAHVVYAHQEHSLLLPVQAYVIHVPLARSLPLVNHPVRYVPLDTTVQKGPQKQIRIKTSAQREHTLLPAPHPV